MYYYLHTAHFDAALKATMIPAIGLMIGFYIITRMLELLASDKKMWVKVFGVITILVTLVSLIDLLSAGSRAGAGFGG